MTSSPVPLDLRVLELLVSRLCHDMVSPIGAVNNGIELIEEMGEDMGGEAVQLIAQSGRQAAGKLQCFRMAYGAAGGQAAVMAPAEVEATATGWLGDKVAMDWRVTSGDIAASPPPGAAKVLLNAVMLADEALAYGGTVGVGPAEGGLAVTASGRAAALGDERRRALEGGVAVEALSPRTVHAYVTGLFARHYGLDLAWDEPEADRLVLRLAL